MKKIVINLCGVKSKGGITVINNFISQNKSNTLYVLYDNSDLDKYINNFDNKFIDTKRIYHLFLNFFLDKQTLEKINSYDYIIHFGNFGFKTLKKSFVLIQNILPLVKKDTRNVILKILMKRSMKFSNFILIQLEHLKQDIDKNFHSKIIQIGETTSSNVQIANKSGKIVLFGSNVENKNFNFMKSVLENLPNKKKITVINPTTGMESFNVVRTETHFETLELISENEIYFHASEYETVGLPLYEAQNLGLKVVAPICSYTQYFSPESIFLYEMNNLEDALKKIEDAKSSNIESIDTLNYSENWKIVLDNI